MSNAVKKSAQRAILATCLLLPFAAPAQQPSPGGPLAPLHAGPVFAPVKPEKEVEVVVDLAPGSDGRIPSPKAEDARLIEDGKAGAVADQVRRFSDTKKGMALAIAVDVSLSMSGQRLQSVQAALRNEVARKGPEDKVAIMAFATETQVLAPFGASPQELQAAINQLTDQRLRAKLDSGDNARLYKGLNQALDLFGSSSLPARHRLLVVATGKNPKNDAGFTPGQIVTKAMRLQIPIDSIGVPAPVVVPDDDINKLRAILDLPPNNTAQQQARNDVEAFLENLQSLSSDTHGFYIRHAAKDTQLGAQLERGIAWMRASPVYRFKIDSTLFDGKTHPMAVQLSGVDLDVEPVMLYSDVSVIQKYGYFIVGGIILLGIIVVALQSSRKPAPRVRTPVPVDATPRPQPVARPGATPPPPGTPNMSHFQGGFQPPPPPRNPPVNRPGTVREPPNPAAPPQRFGTMVVNASFPPPQPGRPTCRLHILNGPQAGHRMPVEAEQVLIGRGTDLPLSCAFDGAISDPHAEIRYQHGLLLIVDLNSSNGTWLNGQRLSPHMPAPLSIGSRLHLGQTDFEIDQ